MDTSSRTGRALGQSTPHLTPQQIKILALRLIERHSAREVAHRTGVSIGQVYRVVWDARKKFPNLARQFPSRRRVSTGL
jgi:DNA-directed RNA polymerase specialized sigma24 family protein